MLLEDGGRIAKYALEAWKKFPNPAIVANILEVFLTGNPLSAHAVRSKIERKFGPDDPGTISKYLPVLEENGLLTSRTLSYRTNSKSVVGQTRQYTITPKGRTLYDELKLALNKFSQQNS